MYESSLGQRIKKARKGARLTQSQLGEAIRPEKPYSASSISEWESGTTTPPFRVLEAIAAATAVSEQWLAFGEAANVRPSMVSEPAPLAEGERLLEAAQRLLESAGFIVQAPGGPGRAPHTNTPQEEQLLAAWHRMDEERRKRTLVDAQERAEISERGPPGAVGSRGGSDLKRLGGGKGSG